MLKFFHGLRGKLILTYTLVTVLALLALEVLILGSMFLLFSLLDYDTHDYLNDVTYTLYPQANDFMLPGRLDQPGLQAWLERVYDSGQASGEPLNLFDSAVALIVESDPMYVLSPERVVLAQAPAGQDSLVGRSYQLPDYVPSEAILERALRGDVDGLRTSVVTPHGKRLLISPVLDPENRREVLGAIVVTVEPTPPLLWSILPVLLGWVLLTGVVLLMAVAPFGALFGLIMSRPLTRRLRALASVADAWSEGNFQAAPLDRSRDEIGTLGMHMRHMAERLQDLMKTQKALAMMEERNRLARDLHDTVKQQTFATLMQVRAARNLLARDPQAARAHLEEAEGLIKASQQELGLIIAELRPAALDEQGLAGALRHYLQALAQTTHIPVDFQVRNERGLPMEIEQALYRVAQEALSNVARHSRATAVSVQLDYQYQQVRLVITDNGVGFDPHLPRPAGFGLQSMRERLAAFGGQLTVESSVDTGDPGTTLTAIIPISEG